MNRKPNAWQIGAAVIAAAVVIRLAKPAASLFLQPRTAAMLLYLESGRVAVPPLSYPAESPPPIASESAATKPGSQPRAVPVFAAEEALEVEIDSDISWEPDLEALMTRQLAWSLDDGQPRVLIMHTHGTECYTPAAGETFDMQENYRTLDEDYNMISIGAEVARLLTEAGIGVVHGREIHDYPSFNSSYSNARAQTARYLEEYPTVSMVLDLHRDAADTPTGQMDTSARVKGQESSQLMLVIGTDDGGLEHPHWQENLALALKLQVQLDSRYPGLCRPISLCTQRFNEDLSPGALLIEVGAAGNTHEEAMVAAAALAEGIIALSRGANLT